MKKELSKIDIRMPGATVRKIKSIFGEITQKGQIVQVAMQETAALYYEAGELMQTAYCQMPAGTGMKEFCDRFKADLDPKMVRTALKLYDFFVNDPEQIKTLSIGEAISVIANAADAKLPAKEAETEKPAKMVRYGGGTYNDPMMPPDDWNSLFNRQPMAPVKLERFRLERHGDGILWLCDRSLGTPTTFVETYFTPPDKDILKVAWDNMMIKMQKAAEEYFSTLEKEEKNE